MRVDVLPAAATQRDLVGRLLELNAYEFSAFDGRDVNERGEYGYRYLDHYWTEPLDRRPFLIRCDGRVAGVALVRRGEPHTVAEFLVLPKYRRLGVGKAAAATVMRTWLGAWSTHQVLGNEAATAFWRRAIPFPYTETTDESGTTQSFVVAANGVEIE